MLASQLILVARASRFAEMRMLDPTCSPQFEELKNGRFGTKVPRDPKSAGGNGSSEVGLSQYSP